MQGPGGAGRINGWMVATALLAAAAIGLAIFAFITKSDLNDANATIKRQNAELASTEQTAANTEAKDVAVAERFRRRYRQVRRRYLREDKTAAQLAGDIDTENGQLEQAQQETANATSQDEKAAAKLKQSREETDLAAACARGAIGAIDLFFEASDASAGAQTATDRLEKLQNRCQEAVGAS